MSILNNASRCGNFTSSEIFKLLTKDRSGKGFGKPALTYIQEKNFERKLGRSISNETYAKPLSWGHLLEPFAFEALGLEYILTSDQTFDHPAIDYWLGSPDGHKHEWETVVDYKAPFTLLSFCKMVEPIYEGLNGMEAMEYLRVEHEDGNKYYWQLVSNAIIKGSKYCELIIYMPYQSELKEIQERSMDNWVVNAGPKDLPYLIDGGYYRNLNIIRFEPPKSDIDLLTETVIKAGELLIKQPSILIAEQQDTGV